MNELERALVADSAAAPAANILEGADDGLVQRRIAGAPHTIYEELWHLAFWQQMTVDWISGIETPYPEHASEGFPSPEQIASESWTALCGRFFTGLESAAAASRDLATLERVVRCPSRAGAPVRTMTVREQLESLAAHNTYHLGRIVLLRQIGGAWPPPSGGDTW